MPKPLIIVESPAKARTIAGYLGSDYEVASSVGHIRDLPRNAKEVPEKLKGEPWARLGVNVEAGFEPLYIVTKEKKDTVKELRTRNADNLAAGMQEVNQVKKLTRNVPTATIAKKWIEQAGTMDPVIKH